jgi:beta-glucosidase-like glycosyl hydrolase
MKVDPMKPARVLPVVFAGIVLSVLSASSAERHPGWLRANDARVEALLSRMTLEEKVGQMTQAEQDKLADVRDIETYFLGSLLSGGSSDPKTNSFEDWRDMYDRYQSHALKTRLAIPILYGVDAVHGHNNVLGAVIFPHNIGLGATRDATLVEEVARATAREVRATGIQWAFAPCVTVPRDERWGRTYEGYAEDPQVVAELGAAAVRGLQGDDPAAPTSVLACVKHFAGDGGTIFGTGRVDAKSGQRNPLDRGDVRLSEAELKRIHMPGYRTAIDAGAMTIMPSYNSWNGEKASGSRRLLTDILKGELGFDGFLISDYDAIEELPGTYREQVKASVLAGMDMFMVSARYREFYTTLKGLVEDRSVPATRIDDAVRRILRVKVALGLLDERRSPLADRSLASSFGSTEHRALGRRAVRESLVLLKNDKHTLPLSKTLDHRLAGHDRRQHHRHHDPGCAAQGGGAGDEGDVLRGRPRRERRGRRGGGRRRDALRRVRRRPRRSLALRRRPERPRARAGSGRAGGDARDLRPAPHPRRCAGRVRRARRGVAARHRGRRRDRRVVRRHEADGQAAHDLAAHDGADPDQRRRRGLRPAVPVRAWAHLRRPRRGQRETHDRGHAVTSIPASQVARRTCG